MNISCHLKGFLKKMKFSMIANLQKNVVFGLLYLLQNLHPNEEIITF